MLQEGIFCNAYVSFACTPRILRRPRSVVDPTRQTAACPTHPARPHEVCRDGRSTELCSSVNHSLTAVREVVVVVVVVRVYRRTLVRSADSDAVSRPTAEPQLVHDSQARSEFNAPEMSSEQG